MRHQVNIHEAKSQLSRLIQQASDGQDVVIARAGKPVACLTAYHPAGTTRKPGRWRNRVEIADDFDSLPVSLTSAFRGEAN